MTAQYYSLYKCVCGGDTLGNRSCSGLFSGSLKKVGRCRQGETIHKSTAGWVPEDPVLDVFTATLPRGPTLGYGHRNAMKIFETLTRWSSLGYIWQGQISHLRLFGWCIRRCSATARMTARSRCEKSFEERNVKLFFWDWPSCEVENICKPFVTSCAKTQQASG